MQEESGVADFAEADRDAVQVREDFWTLSGEFICRHHVMLWEQVYVPKESSFPILFKYIDVERKTKTNLDNLEESSNDDL